MGLLIGLSNAIKRVLEVVAFGSGWLLIVLMCITCTDVVARKFGIPIPLTKFQELEWYMHTALFSMWMGYNYTINAHPRVDSYTETLPFRAKAWIEFWGCLLFALPYSWLLVLARLGLLLDVLSAERELRERGRPRASLDHQGRLLRSGCGCCSPASSASCCG